MNRGKIIKLNSLDLFKVKYGTIDNQDIRSLYINYRAWVKLTVDSNNPQSLINQLAKKLKTGLYENVNTDYFKKDIILIDLDIRESGLINSDLTFMSLDVHLYKNTEAELTLKDEELNHVMINMIELLSKILLDFKEFEYYKEKK